MNTYLGLVHQESIYDEIYVYRKLFPTEEGIFIRQTITMLAKLLEIEAKVVDMLIEPEPLQVAR